ncbi:Sin-like protein conserved region-domain-containing protein [Fimicolochytrium jonesii]|uniref:Sin-like protein conserved region-domain-containing protein n=1 Tax=Fimicolochytrium jonesii TaxID=1396493 RepID=UPI0022FDEF3F|nr:Sin-like protein conserved region-domain-containing protein [Fimicolochytrium jonesii]KAI8821517.1 Sin-like protein conserved region-domain-containing protein [Fimicolochytrium jonesii]
MSDTMDLTDEVDDLMDVDEGDQMVEDDEMIEDDDEQENPAGQAEVDEDGDHIVKEIDVFFSHTLTDTLYLFQFPTRLHDFDEDNKPSVGRVKPKTKRFEIDIPLQTGSEYYNKERGEELGQGTDNAPMRGVYDYDDHTPKKLLEKQTLSSSLLPSQANYMVGVMKEDQLHLTPINMALQLRPSLYYIDKITEKQAARYQEDSVEANKRANPEYEEEAKILSVTIKGPEDKEGIRRAAQAELQRKAEEEAWQKMFIHHAESELSKKVIAQLYSTSEGDVDVTSTPAGYLNDLDPTFNAQSYDASHIKVRKGLTLTQIAKLTLAEKVKAILMNANVAQFHTIAKMLGNITELDVEELLASLRAAAVLVRGVWIVRSELMYTDYALHARRWLLYMFQQSQYISRREFSDYVRIPGTMATSMLSEIAVLEAGKGWVLKVAPDEQFVADFDDVLVEQAMTVEAEAQEARLLWEPRVVKPAALPKAAAKAAAKRPPSASAAAKASAAASASTQKPAAKAQAGPPPAAAPAPAPSAPPAANTPARGGTVHQHVVAAIANLYTENYVISGDYIASAVLAQDAGTTREDIVAATASFCVQIRDDLWVRKSVGHAQIDEFRPIIIDLFRSKDVIAKKEINEVTKAQKQCEVPVAPYSKIMHELSKSVGGGRWVSCCVCLERRL